MRKICVMQIVITLLLSTLYAHVEKMIELRLSSPLEIGRESLLFGSIVSICEDDQENFYVLDKLESKMFKFSSSGKRLLSFGNEGQGPGDFLRPNRIAFTENGKIVVADELYYLSFLNEDGTFIKRIDLNGRITPGYIGSDSFYAWIWLPKDKQQIMCDANNTIVHTFHTVLKGSFSVDAPDSSGRSVMFSYPRDEFAPTFIFAHSVKHTAIAVNDMYEITLLDSSGKILRKITRDIPPERIEKRERDFFVKDIEIIANQKGWPKSVSRKILKIIPKEKTFFDRILLTSHCIFVFRIKNDITLEKSPIRVDVFSLDGIFMGTTSMDHKPIFMSDKYMYFVKSDESGNLFLVRMEYQLKL
jgi:hypothetical protein